MRCSYRSIFLSCPLDKHNCIHSLGDPPHTPCPQGRGSSHTHCSEEDICHLKFNQRILRTAFSLAEVGRAQGDGSTFTLARCGPHVAWGHKAEAGCTVGGHGAFVQCDHLVAESQRAVQTRAELLDHPNDADPRHLFNHPSRRVQLPEDNLRMSRRGA